MSAEWRYVGRDAYDATMPDGRTLRAYNRTAPPFEWFVTGANTLRVEAEGHCDTAKQAREASERAWAEMQPPAPADQPLPTPSKHPAIVDLLIASLQARAAKGLATYGQPLRAFNGRDPLRDLEEELLDGAMYARQAREERDALRAENERLRAECRRRALIIGETVRQRKSAQKRAVKIACAIAGERIKDALDGTRAVLGAAPVTGDPDGESTVDTAKRVVAERDALRAENARLTALLRDRDAAAVAQLAGAQAASDPRAIAESARHLLLEMDESGASTVVNVAGLRSALIAFDRSSP